MTVRAPLYQIAGDLYEMTPAEVVEWQDRAIYEYSIAPSSVLNVVSSGGNVGTITDTRTAAGAYRTSVSSYPSEGTTPEPTTVSVGYARLSENRTSPGSQVADTGVSYPVYWDGADIRAMSFTDLFDTFISPAIDNMVTASTASTRTGGTYTISSSTSLANHTLVSGTPIFSDTRANTGAYSAGGIPEALDQPLTYTNYYLHRRNGLLVTPSRALMYVDGSADVRMFSDSGAAALLGNWLKHNASVVTGNRIAYNYTVGTVRGTNISNTKLNGAGNRQIRFVNANDYRAQEFPNGSAVTVNTYNLRIRRV
jgi:hypothetical protein